MSRADMENLLGRLVPFAQQLLEKQGGFLPFGGVLRDDGEFAGLMASATDQPAEHGELLAQLVAGMRAGAQRGEYRATAVCLDVLVNHPDTEEETSAICVRLEDRDGEAVDVYVPYETAEEGNISYGEVFATRGRHEVFGGGVA